MTAAATPSSTTAHVARQPAAVAGGGDERGFACVRPCGRLCSNRMADARISSPGLRPGSVCSRDDVPSGWCATPGRSPGLRDRYAPLPVLPASVATIATNSFASTGFARCAWYPDSSAFVRSSPRAERRRRHRRRPAPLLVRQRRTIRMNWYPSVPGMPMSLTITSGRTRFSSSSASSALAAVWTSTPCCWSIRAGQAAGVRLVVDDQDPQVGNRRRRVTPHRRSVSGLLRPLFVSCGRRNLQRQAHHEGAPLPCSAAMGDDRPAVHLDQMLHQRQAEPQPAVPSLRAAVSLAEAIEHERQQVGRDPLPRIGDAHLDVRVDVAPTRPARGPASA